MAKRQVALLANAREVRSFQFIKFSKATFKDEKEMIKKFVAIKNGEKHIKMFLDKNINEVNVPQGHIIIQVYLEK